MKGILHKKINGTWVVRVKSEELPACSTITEHGKEYPIQPEYVKCYFLDEDADGGEVEFEIVKEYDEGGVKGITRYAKLIKPKQEVGNDGFLFDAGSTYPPNVPKLGNEDVPKLGDDVEDYINKRLENLEDIRNQLVEDNMPHNATQNRIDELLSLKHQIFQQNDVKGGELATFKNNDVREDDVEKLAVEFLVDELIKLGYLHSKEHGQSPIVNKYIRQAKQMELKAKENTYTEEQVRKAMRFSYSSGIIEVDYDEMFESFIKSLKQPK